MFTKSLKGLKKKKKLTMIEGKSQKLDKWNSSDVWVGLQTKRKFRFLKCPSIFIGRVFKNHPYSVPFSFLPTVLRFFKN